MKNLNASKTRATSAMRRQLVLLGNIKPAAPTPDMQALHELQHKGHGVCSRTEAILARRRELGKA